jgi:hypothetical protein
VQAATLRSAMSMALGMCRTFPIPAGLQPGLLHLHGRWRGLAANAMPAPSKVVSDMLKRSDLRRGIQYAAQFFVPKARFAPGISCRTFGGKHHHFVGYYDVDPIDESGRDLLCHRVDEKYTGMVEPELGDVGLFSLASGAFRPLVQTRALNWQLASRAQWLNGKTIIYNDLAGGTQVSRVFDVSSGRFVQEFARPFWAISPDRQCAVSMNFARIRLKRPGYGYVGESADGDGDILTVFSLKTGSTLHQIDLRSLCAQVGFPFHGDLDAYLNHVTWSPCSRKFIAVFHFTDPKNGRRANYPVLIECGDYRADLFHDEGVFSHYAWLDSTRLLAYLKFSGMNQFALWTAGQGWQALPCSMPLHDGHPSLVPGSADSIVVDSYPDRFGRMSLYRGSASQSGRLLKLGTMMNAAKYRGPLRCDLHPRVSKHRQLIICDAPFRSGRRVAVIDAAVGSVVLSGERQPV